MGRSPDLRCTAISAFTRVVDALQLRSRDAFHLSRPACGEGGPHEVRWEGRRDQRSFYETNETLTPTPLPPRGACHRAGHFGPDPLAWSPSPVSRGRMSRILLAARLRTLVIARSVSDEAIQGG
jgi:hypothetical protein